MMTIPLISCLEFILFFLLKVLWQIANKKISTSDVLSFVYVPVKLLTSGLADCKSRGYEFEPQPGWDWFPPTGVMSSSPSLAEIDPLPPPIFTDSRSAVVNYWWKYVHLARA